MGRKAPDLGIPLARITRRDSAETMKAPPSVDETTGWTFHWTSGGAEMFYVGLDIHKSQITGCVLDSDGKVFQRWQVRDATG